MAWNEPLTVIITSSLAFIVSPNILSRVIDDAGLSKINVVFQEKNIGWLASDIVRS